MKNIKIFAGLAAILLLFAFSGKIVEDVDAGEIVVIQDAIDGELHTWKYSEYKEGNMYLYKKCEKCSKPGREEL